MLFSVNRRAYHTRVATLFPDGRCTIPNKLRRSHRDRYLNMLQVVRESNSAQLVLQVTSLFPDNADFSDRSFTNNEFCSFCRVISRCTKTVESLTLRGCSLSSTNTQLLADAVFHMPGKVSRELVLSAALKHLHSMGTLINKYICFYRLFKVREAWKKDSYLREAW